MAGSYSGEGGAYVADSTSTFFSVFTKDAVVAMPLNLPQYSGIVTEKGTSSTPEWLQEFDPATSNEVEFLNSKYRNTHLDYSPHAPVDESAENVLPLNSATLQSISQIKPVPDKYWDNMEMVPFPWLPYVMQCEPGYSLLDDSKERVIGYGKYMHMHAMMENPTGCKLPDRDDPAYISNIWTPTSWLAPKPLIADECESYSITHKNESFLNCFYVSGRYYVRCRYMEDHLVTDTFAKW